MKSLPIRIRLTLWYFAMFASAALLLSLASWWMLRRAVDATEYHELHERAQDVQELLNHEDPARGLDEIRDEFAAIYNFKDDGKYLQIRDEQGNWIYRSKRMIMQNPGLPAPGLSPRHRRRSPSFSRGFIQSACWIIRSRRRASGTRCKPVCR